MRKGVEQREIKAIVKADGTIEPIAAKTGELLTIVIETGSVHVQVVSADTGENLDGVTVKLCRRTSRTCQTAPGTGIAIFDSVMPGLYRIEISSDGIESDYYEASNVPEFSVAGGERRVVVVQLRLLASLRVKVIGADTGGTLAGAVIEAYGPRTSVRKEQPKDDFSDLGKLTPGRYEISVTLPDDIARSYSSLGHRFLQVPAGKMTEVVIEVRKCIRVLLWHISELGGGFCWPEARSQFSIDAYATIISHLKADICVLAGLRQNGPSRMEQSTMSDDSECFLPAEPTVGSGAIEVERIVDALGKMDSSGSWKSAFLITEDGESILYQGGSTTCVLFKNGDSLKLRTVRLIEGSRDRIPGVPAELLCARFEVTGSEESSSYELAIAAPLAVPVGSERRAVTSGGEPEKKVLPAAVDQPAAYLLAVSSSHDFSNDRRLIDASRGADASRQPGSYVRFTVLGRSYWETVVRSVEGLIDNPACVAWNDPRLFDELMHWEAMELPDHPDESAKLQGELSDLFLVEGDRSTPGPVLRESRVVDLVRASLKKGRSQSTRSSPGTPHATDEPLEDGVLAELCREHLESMVGTPAPENEDDAVTAIAQSIHFARSLSDHWPVLGIVDAVTERQEQ